MKVRNGFVSNSSSTSFCICGIDTDKDSLKSGIRVIDEGYGTATITKNRKALQIDAYSDYSSDTIRIGLNISNMGKSETRQEFEDRTIVELNKILDIPITKVEFLYGESGE